MKKEIVIIIGSIILSAIFFSCKNEKKRIDKVKSNRVFKSENVSFKFLFPDTVYLNKEYNGEIIYNGVLDSISKKVGTHGKVSRFIEYHHTTTNSANISIEMLKDKKLDTAGAVSIDTIPFYNVKFIRLGVNYIDGIIDDSAYLENFYEDGEMRVIANRTRATHKVVVIDSAK